MALPTGIILLWYGAIVNIPAGWVLCDGNNGTPNLQDRFVVGAGDSYPPWDNGGATVHNHGFTSDGHFHSLVPGPDIAAGAQFNSDTDTRTVQGWTDNSDSLPPFVALAFIMKT